MYYAIGDWKKATKAFEHVLLKRPRLKSAALCLGEMYQLMNLDEKAILVYKSAQKVALTSDARFHFCGLAAVCSGNYKEAIVYFNKAITIASDNLLYWKTLADVHNRFEHPLEAVYALKNALEIDPNNTEALIEGHKAFLTLWQDSEAHHCLNQCSKIEPNNPNALHLTIKTRLLRGCLNGKQGKKNAFIDSKGRKTISWKYSES